MKYSNHDLIQRKFTYAEKDFTHVKAWNKGMMYDRSFCLSRVGDMGASLYCDPVNF